jgi:polysaccharide export outer membrane protein
LPTGDKRQVPVIYRLDFNKPESFFLSQSFQMRDKDVIYVANHPAAELSKFLTLIVSPLLGAARTAEVLGE